MKEVDVRDYYLISKDDFQKINNFVKDGFFMATVMNNLLEANVLYDQAFDHGQQFEYELNFIVNPGWAAQSEDLYQYHYKQKFTIS
jgi:hypothetical protein